MSVQVFIQMKITTVKFADFTAGCLYDHPGGCQPLEGFIGDHRSIGPPHGDVADVSGCTPQIPDFAGKVRAIVLMEAGKGK